jgi:hypothetical protein
VKDLTHIRRFNESEENLNISDVSDSYKIAKAIDLLKNKDLSFHNKVLNLCKLMDVNPNLELPPLIIPCKITLNNGEKHIAYLEENKVPYHFPDEGEDNRGIWIEYGKKYFNKSRTYWKIEDVKSWEFI